MGGNIIANAAGSINQVHGKGVSFVDYGWEKVAARKLATYKIYSAVGLVHKLCCYPQSPNQYICSSWTFSSKTIHVPPDNAARQRQRSLSRSSSSSASCMTSSSDPVASPIFRTHAARPSRPVVCPPAFAARPSRYGERRMDILVGLCLHCMQPKT